MDPRDVPGGLEFAVHVRPRASREAVGGTHDGALQVAVRQPPADGRANEAVCRVVAEALGIRARDVRVASGGRSRRKRLRALGSPAELRARLATLAEGAV